MATGFPLKAIGGFPPALISAYATSEYSKKKRFCGFFNNEKQGQVKDC